MPLQDIQKKRQAQDVERTLKGVFHLISDKYGEFQQLCRVFNPKRGYSPTASKEIKEIYKMVTAKFAEARALLLLLRGKYRGFVQVDQQMAREVEELALMYRKDYRFFEQNQSSWDREQRVRKEKDVPHHLYSHLYNVYSASSSLPSLILCLQGDSESLEVLKGRVTLDELDICDMEGNEIWFFLAGVKHPEDSILRDKLVETFCQGLPGKIKGVVLKLTGEDEVREETLIAIRRGLLGVPDGEIKVL